MTRGGFGFKAPLPALQSLLGGAIMGFAWALIPGGNDAMVLYGAEPGFARHFTYLAVLTTLVGLESLKRRACSPRNRDLIVTWPSRHALDRTY